MFFNPLSNCIFFVGVCNRNSITKIEMASNVLYKNEAAFKFFWNSSHMSSILFTTLLWLSLEWAAVAQSENRQLCMQTHLFLILTQKSG